MIYSSGLLHTHKRWLAVTLASGGLYVWSCKKAVHNPDPKIRMAFAGSLANVLMQCAFHPMDTVNIAAKSRKKPQSSSEVGRKIYAREGVAGLLKGVTPNFYGNVLYGVVYFWLYKYLKQVVGEKISEERSMVWTYMSASFLAAVFSTYLYFPFDLIKCRMQSRNHVFQYDTLTSAFKKELSQNGITSLYRGVSPFLFTWTLTTTIAFTVYESVMHFYKARCSTHQEFREKEYWYNLVASFCCGIFSAVATNGLEVLTVKKQTHLDAKVIDLLKNEGWSLLTKGIGAKVTYLSMQMVLFFNMVLFIGRIYDVDLTE